jgi:small subunit ribosomal protein S9
MATKAPEFLGTGRRKTAVARVRVTAGNGKISVNGRELDDYFSTENERNSAIEPLVVTDKLKTVNVTILCNGGGPIGQAGACKMGLARRAPQVRLGSRRNAASLGSADSRQPHEGTQALRSAWRSPRDAVQQALTARLYEQMKNPRSNAWVFS